MLLFRTKHGSHLYGLAHPGSDKDYFEVHSNEKKTRARYAKQSIQGDYDLLKTDLSTFMQYAAKGVPQYLEAMYSRQPEVDLLGEAFRLSYRPNVEAVHTYQRTIKSFRQSALEEGQPKRLTHALRLGYNLSSLERGSNFDPCLPADLADTFRAYSKAMLGV